MLDDLRNSASSSFLDDPAEDEIMQRAQERKILGMTAPQRFLISLMLLLTTTVFGILLLLLTQKIYIP